MQILFPMGGRGTRVRPHTHVRPKPLMNIAGKPVLQHIMDYLSPLGPSEFIFITNPGQSGEQVRAFVEQAYPSAGTRFLVQEEARGQAHAVALAEEFVREPLLVMFIDTLFEADLTHLDDLPFDGVVVTHYVEDPRRFGIVVSDNGRITRFVEKPEEPISHDGIIGVYYFKQPSSLFDAIRSLMTAGGARNGEYFLADAIQVMVDQGARLTPIQASVWQDTGTIEAIVGSAGPPFQANHYLIERGQMSEAACDNAVIIPPVYLPAGVTISESVVGPYVSVADGAVIRRSVVRESVIGRNTLVDEAHLEFSLIGDEATVQGSTGRLNISDNSSVTM